MTLFISVVNHHHDDLITSNSTLSSLATEHQVIIKSNTEPTSLLTNYCNNSNIHLVTSPGLKGFGANNNEVFSFARTNLGMKDDDWFLVLNPDVEIALETINQLLLCAKSQNADISAINLFKDKEYLIPDNSIRHYPKLLAPLKSIIGIKRTDCHDKSTITKPIKIDWAAGSFLLFSAKCFRILKGFDEKFFMYFEDADICTRANKNGFNIWYFPDIKAIHYASHQNRKIFSKHFVWYWMSSFRYQIKNQINKNKD